MLGIQLRRGCEQQDWPDYRPDVSDHSFVLRGQARTRKKRRDYSPHLIQSGDTAGKGEKLLVRTEQRGRPNCISVETLLSSVSFPRADGSSSQRRHTRSSMTGTSALHQVGGLGSKKTHLLACVRRRWPTCPSAYRRTPGRWVLRMRQRALSEGVSKGPRSSSVTRL